MKRPLCTTEPVARRIGDSPPTSLEPFAIHDHDLVEGVSHVQHRNKFYAQGRVRESWLENAILSSTTTRSSTSDR